MKKLITIFLIIASCNAWAQYPPNTGIVSPVQVAPMTFPNPGAVGTVVQRQAVLQTLYIPTISGVPTNLKMKNIGLSALVYDSTGKALYSFSPTDSTFHIMAGGGASPIDSIVIHTSAYIDSLLYFQGGTRHVIGIIDRADGRIKGGQVTLTSGTTFLVKSALYGIAGLRYTSTISGGDTSITLTALPDTPRLDIIFVNIFGVVGHRTGIEGSGVAPTIDPTTEMVLATIVLNNSSATIITAGDYWGKTPGGDLYPINSSGNVLVTNNFFAGIGVPTSQQTLGRLLIDQNGTTPRLFFGTGLGSGTAQLWFQNTTTGISIVNGSGTKNVISLKTDSGRIQFGFPELVSDTFTYKPYVMDASGNLRRFTYWPTGSGGGTTTLQQALTASAVLTQDNTVEGGNHDFTVQNFSGWHLYSTQTGNFVSGLDIQKTGAGGMFKQTDNGVSRFDMLDTTARMWGTLLSGPGHEWLVSPSLTKLRNNNGSDTALLVIQNAPIAPVMSAYLYAAGPSGELIKLDTAILFAAVRATIAGGSSSTLTVDPDQFKISGDSLFSKGEPNALAFYGADSLLTGTANATLDASGNMVINTLNALGDVGSGGTLTGAGLSIINTLGNNIVINGASNDVNIGQTAGNTNIFIRPGDGNVISNAPNGTILSTPQTTGIDLSSGPFTVTTGGTYQIVTGDLVNPLTLPDATTFTTNTITIHVQVNRSETALIVDAAGNPIYNTVGTVIPSIAGGVGTGGATYTFQPIDGSWHQF